MIASVQKKLSFVYQHIHDTILGLYMWHAQTESEMHLHMHNVLLSVNNTPIYPAIIVEGTYMYMYVCDSM